jgi:hypothetical protein
VVPDLQKSARHTLIPHCARHLLLISIALLMIPGARISLPVNQMSRLLFGSSSADAKTAFAVLDFHRIRFVTMTGPRSMPRLRVRAPNKRQATNVIDLVSVLQESLQKLKSKSAA